jgi:hypothetical protein
MCNLQIGKRRADLDDLLSYFSIDGSNPISVMTQVCHLHRTFPAQHPVAMACLKKHHSTSIRNSLCKIFYRKEIAQQKLGIFSIYLAKELLIGADCKNYLQCLVHAELKVLGGWYVLKNCPCSPEYLLLRLIAGCDAELPCWQH